MSINRIHGVKLKGNNKRIELHLFEDQEEKFIQLKTKTLKSFKERLIIETNNIYSIETIFVISNLLDAFFSNSEIKNKILLREINECQKFEGTTTLKNI